MFEIKAILLPSPLIAGSKLACVGRGAVAAVIGWMVKVDGTVLSSRDSNDRPTERRRDAWRGVLLPVSVASQCRFKNQLLNLMMRTSTMRVVCESGAGPHVLRA